MKTGNPEQIAFRPPDSLFCDMTIFGAHIKESLGSLCIVKRRKGCFGTSDFFHSVISSSFLFIARFADNILFSPYCKERRHPHSIFDLYWNCRSFSPLDWRTLSVIIRPPVVGWLFFYFFLILSRRIRAGKSALNDQF